MSPYDWLNLSEILYTNCHARYIYTIHSVLHLYCIVWKVHTACPIVLVSFPGRGSSLGMRPDSTACVLVPQIKLVNMQNESLVDGNSKLTLGLVWTLILHFQVSNGLKKAYVARNIHDLICDDTSLLFTCVVLLSMFSILSSYPVLFIGFVCALY